MRRPWKRLMGSSKVADFCESVWIESAGIASRIAASAMLRSRRARPASARLPAGAGAGVSARLDRAGHRRGPSGLVSSLEAREVRPEEGILGLELEGAPEGRDGARAVA